MSSALLTHSCRRAERIAEEERIKNAKAIHKKELRDANVKSQAMRQELDKRGSQIKDVLVSAFRKGRCLMAGQGSD